MKFFNLDNVDFKNVGGLEEQIRCLKEMVLFPLTYRDIYDKFHIKPPRGVLFHGPPGTGKTLLARALANECSRDVRKVSFFNLKGAECLSKWVGESEKKLRTLFETAQQTRPSIIFFDEIDGLTPTRSSRQDQVHSSVVSTLLALMDGLDAHTEVIVIGATNRIDAIDPALRRPGRFDRELYFPPPTLKERRDILCVYVDHWNNKPSSEFINKLASDTIGYCGSDLQALCSEAVMCGLRRQYPHIYTSNHKVNVDSKSFQVENCDFLSAKAKIEPAAHRTMHSPVKRLSSVIRPLLQGTLDSTLSWIKTHYPFEFLNPESKISNVDDIFYCPRVLLTGTSEQGQTIHLAPAVLHHFEHLAVHILDLACLFKGSGQCTDESCIQKMKKVWQNLPAILYMPDISGWWDLVDEATRAVFLDLLHNLDRSKPLFLLATSHTKYCEMASPLQNLFNMYQGQVVEMENPTCIERKQFFWPLFTVKCIIPPPSFNSDASNMQSCRKSERCIQRGKQKEVTSLPQYGIRCSRRIRGLSALSLEEIKNGTPSYLHSDRSSLRINNPGPSPKKPKLSPSKQFLEENLFNQEDPNSGSGDEVPEEIMIKEETKSFTTEFPSLTVFKEDLDDEMSCYNLSGLDLSDIEKVVIDRARLFELLHRVTNVTDSCPVEILEVLYGDLNACILQYRYKWERTQLLNDLELNIDRFEEKYLSKPHSCSNWTVSSQDSMNFRPVYIPQQP